MQNHKDLDQKIKTIGRHPIFKSNSRDELAPLARAAEWRGFRRGEMIFRQGDAPHHAHIVHTGRVKVFKTSVGGQAFITMIAGPHNTLNAVTCFGCKPRFFSAEALEDVRLVAIPTKPFVDFVFHHPVTAQAAGISTHPRNFGTFPRVLGHYCRDAGLISLEVAVHKMTGLAARYLGLKDRGLIREGLAADLTIFDPRTIIDTATYEQPKSYPLGIDYVLVAGRVVVDQHGHTGARPGRVLRRP
jgi:CRP-like cAMP-binding protein